MKKALLYLILFVQIGGQVYVNPAHVAEVSRYWSPGNRHAAGHWTDETIIRLDDGHEIITDWSLVRVLHALAEK